MEYDSIIKSNSQHEKVHLSHSNRKKRTRIGQVGMLTSLQVVYGKELRNLLSRDF